MDAPTVMRVIWWLVRDTFHQARASGILWLMLGVSGLCIFFCLSVSVSGGTTVYPRGEMREYVPPTDPTARPDVLERHGVDAPSGELRLLFGLFRVSFQHYREEVVSFLELLLAGGVADAAGVLLVLTWTAGFLPSFLERSQALVMLAKPTPRWLLLLGKYLGVLTFVFVQACLFVGGTWLALGLRTGVWAFAYLLCIPLLVVQIAVFFSASVLLAVLCRSPIVCILGSILFWFVCWLVNYAHCVLALASPGDWPAGAHAGVRGLVEGLYWILPKPMDMTLIVFDALGAGPYFARTLDVDRLSRSGAFWAELSVFSSLLSAGLLLALAAYRFKRTEY